MNLFADVDRLKAKWDAQIAQLRTDLDYFGGTFTGWESDGAITTYKARKGMAFFKANAQRELVELVHRHVHPECFGAPAAKAKCARVGR